SEAGPGGNPLRPGRKPVTQLPVSDGGRSRLSATIPRSRSRSVALLHHLGRSGQWLGLAIPAVAIVLELAHAITLGQMLVMLVAAVCCFWIGRILEGYAGR
ncbi:MAG: hypothetical protein ACKOTB_11145, partial [Planctomycetia bacterium]